MVRLALGPLILTGLFLAGSLHASSALAETIDLTTRTRFAAEPVDWLEDGSILKLKRISPPARPTRFLLDIGRQDSTISM